MEMGPGSILLLVLIVAGMTGYAVHKIKDRRNK